MYLKQDNVVGGSFVVKFCSRNGRPLTAPPAMCVICPSMRVGTVVAAAGAATALWLLYRRRSSQGVGASEAGASSVDYVTELVCSPVAAESPPITYKRLSLDRFFGLFTKMYLCPTWFYDRPLDPVHHSLLHHRIEGAPSQRGHYSPPFVAQCIPPRR